jgi:hypothetical protein
MTYIKIQAPAAGTLNLNYTWTSADPGDQQLPNTAFDWPFYSVDQQEPYGTDDGDNGLPSNYPNTFASGNPTINTPQSGQLSITFSQGEWISIGVYSTDNIAGAGQLILTNVLPVDPDISLCGMTSTTVTPGCGTSRVFPVDISDVVQLGSVGPKNITDQEKRSGALSENNAFSSNKDVTLRRVAQRLVDAINTNTLLKITARIGKKSNTVVVQQAVTGPSGNTPVYALPKSNAGLGEGSDNYGYVTTPQPRRLGLKSRTKYETFYFVGGSESTANFPFGVPYDSGDPFSSARSIVRKMMATPHAGTLEVPGAGAGGLVNVLSDQHPVCEFTPFDETNSQAAFGVSGGSSLYGTQTEVDDEFFTRGSTLGPLDEPLRNKDKIVIDLTPTVDTTLHLSGGDPNYTMAYYNFDSRRWEPIGKGLQVSTATTLDDVFDRGYIGFGPNWKNSKQNSVGSLPAPFFSTTIDLDIIDPQLRSTFTGEKKVFTEPGWASPTDTFGFPLHPKYHATGSQQLDAENIVDRPFLVEKIVYEFSASMPNLQSRLTSNDYEGSGGTFFILNQRKANPNPGQEISYTKAYIYSRLNGILITAYSIPSRGGNYLIKSYNNGGIPRNLQLSRSGPQVYVDTVRDLVTFARVGTVWPSYDEEIDADIEPEFPHPADFMDLAIEVPPSGTFSGSFTLAAPVRAPSSSESNSYYNFQAVNTPTDNYTGLYSSKLSSTRNSIDIPTGRAYRSEFLGPEIAYKYDYIPFGGLLGKYSVDAPHPGKDSEPSPYLIRPGDKLVFGWQSPISNDITSSNPETTFNILAGKGKITLYGSYLKDNKPVHNIFQECLTSEALHETIPSGPWVLDQFDSEPTMVFSGSMREEYVTGSMVTKGSRGALIVTDENILNSGTFGVRVVGARASDGNLKQRYSFSRNLSAYDLSEQYYDSMQPNPIKLLFEYEGSTARALSTNADKDIAWAFIMPPSGSVDGLPSDPYYNTGLFANRVFIGSFPFDSIYRNIPRVPKIDSKLILRSPVETYRFKSSLTPSSQESHGLQKISYLGFRDTYDNQLSADRALVVSPSVTGYGIMGIPTTDDDFDTEPYLGGPLGFVSGSAKDISSPIFGSYNPKLSRFMGCFGDGYFRLPMYQRDIFAVVVVGLEGMVYRGTKHGLINPIPLFTKSVFSGRHFGHFRDMLEQRQLTKCYDASRRRRSASLSEASVDVIFINRSAPAGTLNLASGEDTNSSNISKFATSEHPYDDALADYGQIWDRDTVLPENL